MATAHLVPEALFTFEEASAMLAETGYPASESKIRRAFRDDPELKVQRRGKRVFVDMDDVYEWHRDKVMNRSQET